MRSDVPKELDIVFLPTCVEVRRVLAYYIQSCRSLSSHGPLRAPRPRECIGRFMNTSPVKISLLQELGLRQEGCLEQFERVFLLYARSGHWQIVGDQENQYGVSHVDQRFRSTNP